MADLTHIEKRKLEELLGMASGYVLSFSDRTFGDFVTDSVGENIFDNKYNNASGSKANRLRAFLKIEPNHIAGKLLGDLLQYFSEFNTITVDNKKLLGECQRIVQRLMESAPVSDLSAIAPNSDGRDFEALARSVRESIDRNEPETGLDRLHTFVVKYVRVLCEKHGISIDRNKPLHSLVGEYVKTIRQKGLIESEMAERILRSSISTMEAFNDVRNNKSLAHDNPTLAYSESLLIFSHVASAIRFIASIENQSSKSGQQVPPDAEIPF